MRLPATQRWIISRSRRAGSGVLRFSRRTPPQRRRHIYKNTKYICHFGTRLVVPTTGPGLSGKPSRGRREPVSYFGQSRANVGFESQYLGRRRRASRRSRMFTPFNQAPRILISIAQLRWYRRAAHQASASANMTSRRSRAPAHSSRRVCR